MKKIGSFPYKFQPQVDNNNMFCGYFSKSIEPGKYIQNNDFLFMRIFKIASKIFKDDQLEIKITKNQLILKLPVFYFNLQNLIDEVLDQSLESDLIDLLNTLVYSSNINFYAMDSQEKKFTEISISNNKINLFIQSNSDTITDNFHSPGFLYIESKMFQRTHVDIIQNSDSFFDDFEDNQLYYLLLFKSYFEYFELPENFKIYDISGYEFYDRLLNFINSEDIEFEININQFCGGYNNIREITHRAILQNRFEVFVQPESENMFFLNSRIENKIDAQYIKLFDNIWANENYIFNKFNFREIEFTDDGYSKGIDEYIDELDNYLKENIDLFMTQCPYEKSFDRLVFLYENISNKFSKISDRTFLQNITKLSDNILDTLNVFNKNHFIRILSKMLNDEYSYCRHLLNGNRFIKLYSNDVETLGRFIDTMLWHHLKNQKIIVLLSQKELNRVSKNIKKLANQNSEAVVIFSSKNNLMIHLVYRFLKKSGFNVILDDDLKQVSQIKIDDVQNDKIKINTNDLVVIRYSDNKYLMNSIKYKQDDFMKEFALIKKIIEDNYSKNIIFLNAGDYRTMKIKPQLLDEFINSNRDEFINKLISYDFLNKYGCELSNILGNIFYNFNFFTLPLSIQNEFKEIIDDYDSSILVARDFILSYDVNGVFDPENTIQNLLKLSNSNRLTLPKNLLRLSSSELNLIQKQEVNEFTKFTDNNSLYEKLNNLVYQSILDFWLIEFQRTLPDNEFKRFISDNLFKTSRTIGCPNILEEYRYNVNTSNCIRILNRSIPVDSIKNIKNMDSFKDGYINDELNNLIHGIKLILKNSIRGEIIECFK